MDKLYKSAKYYKDNLEGRSYLLVACKNRNYLVLEIAFTEYAYKHLVGLHKLTDTGLYNLSGKDIYMQILNKITTEEDIKKSDFYSDVKSRLDNFEKISILLSSPETMKKSLYGSFGYGRGISADYLLSQKTDDKFVHLFLKDKNDIVLPVTFFTEKTDFYLRNNTTNWNIVDIEELTEKDDAKRKAEIMELRAKLTMSTSRSFDEMREIVRGTVNTRTNDAKLDTYTNDKDEHDD